MQNTDGQWMRSKSFDTFAPFGPAVLLQKELPASTVVRTMVNGCIKQQSEISQMIFSVPKIIAHISRFATLEQGDVIATGTPEGVGPIVCGDIVEIEIDGIGKLRSICSE